MAEILFGDSFGDLGRQELARRQARDARFFQAADLSRLNRAQELQAQQNRASNQLRAIQVANQQNQFAQSLAADNAARQTAALADMARTRASGQLAREAELGRDRRQSAELESLEDRSKGRLDLTRELEESRAQREESRDEKVRQAGLLARGLSLLTDSAQSPDEIFKVIPDLNESNRALISSHAKGIGRQENLDNETAIQSAQQANRMFNEFNTVTTRLRQIVSDPDLNPTDLPKLVSEAYKGTLVPRPGANELNDPELLGRFAETLLPALIENQAKTNPRIFFDTTPGVSRFVPRTTREFQFSSGDAARGSGGSGGGGPRAAATPSFDPSGLSDENLIKFEGYKQFYSQMIQAGADDATADAEAKRRAAVALKSAVDSGTLERTASALRQRASAPLARPRPAGTGTDRTAGADATGTVGAAAGGTVGANQQRAQIAPARPVPAPVPVAPITGQGGGSIDFLEGFPTDPNAPAPLPDPFAPLQRLGQEQEQDIRFDAPLSSGPVPRPTLADRLTSTQFNVVPGPVGQGRDLSLPEQLAAHEINKRLGAARGVEFLAGRGLGLGFEAAGAVEDSAVAGLEALGELGSQVKEVLTPLPAEELGLENPTDLRRFQDTILRRLRNLDQSLQGRVQDATGSVRDTLRNLPAGFRDVFEEQSTPAPVNRVFPALPREGVRRAVPEGRDREDLVQGMDEDQRTVFTDLMSTGMSENAAFFLSEQITRQNRAIEPAPPSREDLIDRAKLLNTMRFRGVANNEDEAELRRILTQLQQ